MRTAYLLSMVCAPVFNIVVTAWMRGAVSRFLHQTRCIETRTQLVRYEFLATRAMLGKLVQLLSTVAAAVVFGLGVTRGLLLPGHVLLLVVPGTAHLVMYLGYRRIEKRAKSLELDNLTLLDEFNRVQDTWRNKTLPIW